MKKVKQPFAGIFIRDLLRRKGSSYPTEIHREFKEWSKQKNIHQQSYQSVCRYIYQLKRVGLIEPIGTRPSNNPILKDRTYYSVVRGRERSPIWKNPFK